MICPVPGTAAVGADEQIRVDVAELAVALEADLAAVDAGADREIVVVTEHLVVVERLQRGACRHRIGPGAVDRAPGRTRAGIADARGTIDRLVVRIEDLEILLRLLGKPVIVEAQGVEQRIARIAAAALDVGGVAVDVGLLEPAVIEVALDRPMVGHRVAAVERKQLRLVLRRLRPGVDRAIVVVEQLDRRRPDDAEVVVGGRRDEMDLRIGPFPAEIAVEARNSRRRLVAPAVVLETFRGQIEAPFPVAYAVLQRAANPTVGAARTIDLEAAIGKPILHLQAHRTTQGVEAEGRIVGPDVGAADGDGRDEIPVDGIAEGFVDADTLHVDREALRGALQRRGRETAIAQILEETVALNVVGDDAGNALLQRIEDIGRIDAREVLGGERLHHRRHLVAVDADSGKRGGGDDLKGGSSTRRGRRRCGRGHPGGDGLAARAARPGGVGGGFGAVTVTSGSVAAAWPQADCGIVRTPGNSSALDATAPNSRRLPAASRPRSPPTVPPMAPPRRRPTKVPWQMLEYFPPTVLVRFANCLWNIWQCGHQDTPQNGMPSPLNAFGCPRQRPAPTIGRPFDNHDPSRYRPAKPDSQHWPPSILPTTEPRALSPG